MLTTEAEAKPAMTVPDSRPAVAPTGGFTPKEIAVPIIDLNSRARIIMMNARRICSRRFRGSPNWVLAMELLGLGSTYAYAFCRQNAIDPEAKTVEWPTTPPPVKPACP